jgi:hypothetical protein
MLQDTYGWLTIHDVAGGMSCVLPDRDAMAIGAAVAAAWEWQTGTPPLKDLRNKKKGPGSHCFALYPEAFRPRIELIIRGYKPPDADQLSLDV